MNCGFIAIYDMLILAILLGQGCMMVVLIALLVQMRRGKP